ncbi:MAG: neuromedin U [Longimicrobiales bacterium]
MRITGNGAAAALLLTFICSLPTKLEAQARPSASELSKQSQNPVGSLAAVPFQFNFNTGGFLQDRTVLVLNFQPVIPFRLNDNFNVIIRPIVPYVNVPLLFGQSESGFGDVQTQLFVAPSKGELIWGIGPSLSFPTATNGFVSTGSWAAGPNAVLSLSTGHWVLGVLARNLWTFSDDGDLIDEVDFLDIDALDRLDDDREVNDLLIQPFINWNFGVGWSLATAPVITANWDADGGDQWTVPLGMGISRTSVLGTHPIILAAHYYKNIVRPDFGPDDQVRLQINFLLPKAPARPSANDHNSDKR